MEETSRIATEEEFLSQDAYAILPMSQIQTRPTKLQFTHFIDRMSEKLYKIYKCGHRRTTQQAKASTK